jgi:hypothetical protein
MSLYLIVSGVPNGNCSVVICVETRERECLLRLEHFGLFIEHGRVLAVMSAGVHRYYNALWRRGGNQAQAHGKG